MQPRPHKPQGRESGGRAGTIFVLDGGVVSVVFFFCFRIYLRTQRLCASQTAEYYLNEDLSAMKNSQDALSFDLVVIFQEKKVK